ncbi:MAG: hypothetical protein L0332_20790 [Chloroflexi bacterium]|nr:hypothetical protein [Chloroflexota bacterium]MCI0577212.1 hypothetical protein [Chloroflexota bacterium]MCI0729135.1 hypothetical protein [Chloroflexota bacterium]
MHSSFQNVWYASEARVQSVTKLVVFSDRGSLEIRPNGLRFDGNEHHFDIPHIRRIMLTHQRLPWLTYLFTNLALLLLLLPTVWFVTPYLERSIPELVLFILSAFIVSNFLGMSVGWSTRWLLVEYEDEQANLNRAYFADGSLLGWGGFWVAPTVCISGSWNTRPRHKAVQQYP